MKKALIVALVCVNLALLAALMLGTAPQPAQAQVAAGAGNYLAVTGLYRGDEEVLYVVDLRTRRLAAWRFDKTNKKMSPFSARELTRDFRRNNGL